MIDTKIARAEKSAIRRAVVVLGMHRSGTSLLSALLCTAGLDAPRNPLPGDVHNEKGYWEPSSIQRLNDELLADIGCTWHTELTFPAEILRTPKLEKYAYEIADALKQEFSGSRFFCLKDPRIARLLPVWMPALKNEGIEASYVLTVRNPLEVAQSLKIRDEFHWSKSLMLWLRHTLEAERSTRNQPRAFVTYDQILANWRGVLRQIAKDLHVSWPRRVSHIDVDFDRILLPRLRHHSISVAELDARGDIARWVSEAYHAFIQAAEGRLEQQLPIFDRIMSEMEEADKAYEPLFVIEQERLASARSQASALAGRVQEHEADLNGLRAELATKTIRVDELSAQSRSAQSDLESARAELAAGQQRLTELNTEIAAARAGLDAAHAESAAQHTRIEELTGVISRLRDDVEAARVQLDAARRDSEGAHSNAAGKQARVDELTAHVAAVQAHLDTAYADLTAKNAQVDDLTAVVNRLRSDLNEVSSQAAEKQARADQLEAELAAAVLDSAGTRGQIDNLIAQIASLHTQRDAIRAQADAAAAESAAKDARVDELMRAIDGVRGELEAVRSESTVKQARVDELTSQIASLNAQHDAARAQYDAAVAESATKSARIDEVTAAIDELRAELESERTESGTKQARIDELTSQIASLNSQRDAARAQCDASVADAATKSARIDEVTAAIDGLRAELESARSECGAKQARIDELASQIASLNAQLDASRAQTDAAIAESAAQQARVDDLLAQIAALGSQLEDARAQAGGAIADSAAARADLEAIRVEYEAARAELAVKHTRLDDLGGQIIAARSDLEAASTQTAAQHARIEDLEALTESLQSELEGSLADLALSRSEAENARTELAAQTERLQELTAQISGTRGELESARAELGSTRVESLEKNQRIKELCETVTALRQDGEAVQAQLERRQADFAALSTELALSRDEVDRLTSRVASYETKLQEAWTETDVVRAEADSYRNELRENRSLVRSAEARVAALSGKISQLTMDLLLTQEEQAGERGRGDAADREREHLRETVARLEVRAQMLNEDLGSARAAAQAANDALSSERTALASSQIELASVRAALNAARADAATAEAQLTALQARGRELAERLSERDEKLASAHAIAPLALTNGVLHRPHEIPHEGNGGRAVPHRVSFVDARLEKRRRDLEIGPCHIADWRVEIPTAAPANLNPSVIGVFVHIYYEDIAAEIAAALKAIPFECRIYVSTANELKKAQIQMAFASEGLGNTVVKIVPNAGRDIGPFLFGFADEIRQHDICLRLHSKKSSHGDPMFGIGWRKYLVDELFGDCERAALAVNAFIEQPRLGMLIPQHWPGVSGWIGIGENWYWLKYLLDRIHVTINPEEPIDYPCGSMFWFRSAALEPLLGLALTPEDFSESNEHNRDSTLAHGVERVFLFVAAKAGYNWAFLPGRERVPQPKLEDAIQMVRESGLFDSEYYIQTNEDVAADGWADPLPHFMEYGYREKRNPSATFDIAYYSRSMLRDGWWGGENPLVHYILEGRQKGLATMPPRKNEEVLPVLTSVADLYAPYKRAESGRDYVPEAFPLIRPTAVKPIAFYFPQFHPFDENNRFWGRGFTEWTNTTKAQPMYAGHYQPRLPGELGFYDTRLKEVLVRQIELAKQYGIYGFCFHHYFFDGKPVMRAPYNHMVANKDLDIPFCLHWANEPWTVRWDGLAKEGGTLLAQHHDAEDDYKFFDDIAPALTDSRYITIDGRPLIVIYRPRLFPSIEETIERWRNCAARLGLKDPYLAVMQNSFEGAVDPAKYGFDAAIEYPPHNIRLSDAASRVTLYDQDFVGRVMDYSEAVDNALARPEPEYKWFRGIVPDWDCTPRRANPDFFIESTPEKYTEWFKRLCTRTERVLPENEQFLFINSWNEWAEGAYLEPDRKFGYAYLDATARALSGYERAIEIRTAPTILVGAHLFYLDLLDEFLDHFDRIPTQFDVFLTVSSRDTSQIEAKIRERLGDKVGSVTIRFVENVGRDGVPFLLHALPEAQRYELCCWTHSKKSPYDSAYKNWRGYLLSNLLGSADAVSAIIENFVTTPTLGVVFPKPFPAVADKVEWGSNFVTTANLLSRLGIRIDESEDPQFPTGMMFWFRPRALRSLLELNLTVDDFIRYGEGAKEQTSGIVFDGTLSHALERMVLYVARDAGYVWKEYLNEPYSPKDNASL